MKKMLVLTIMLLLNGVHALRPHNPYTLRVALKNKPRMVLLALDSSLSVAYDGSSCGLYIAWRGPVQVSDLSYNQAVGNHGATYYPQGKLLFKLAPGAEFSETDPPETRPNTHGCFNDAIVPVWTATQAGQPLALKIRYKGYTVDNGLQTTTLRYMLSPPTGPAIQVSELPDFTKNAGFSDLTRDFTVAGLPAGTKLSLLLSSNPIRKANASLVVETWTATGTGRIETVGGKTYFVTEASGNTRVTGTWR